MDRSFVKHASVYGVAQVLVQAAGFVLLPIYTRCFSPSDYGVLVIVGRLAETVATCLLFSGIRQALMTFYQQADSEAERRSVVTTTLALLALASGVGGVLAALLSPALVNALTPWLGQATALSDGLLRLAVLSIVLEPFVLIPLALLQARVQSLQYIVVVLAQFLFRVTLSIVLVSFLGWGVQGALIANAVQGALFGTLLCLRELRQGVAWPSLTRARQMLTFALPLLPGGLCFFLLHHGDRFFLMRYCSAAEIGTYDLGYRLAAVVGMFSLNPLYMVWGSRMYAEARRPQAPVVFGQTFTRILAAYLFVGLAVCLFADEAVALAAPSAYASAAWIVAPVVLACFFQSASSLMDAGLYVHRRTGIKLGITLATTAVMVALYAVLIPIGGGRGAALATLGGFLFLSLTTYLVTQRIFPVRYEWNRLASLLAWVVALWGVSRFLPVSPAMVAVKGGLLLLAPLGAWFSGLLHASEKQPVYDLVRHLRSLVGSRRLTPEVEGAGLGLAERTILVAGEDDRAEGEAPAEPACPALVGSTAAPSRNDRPA